MKSVSITSLSRSRSKPTSSIKNAETYEEHGIDMQCEMGVASPTGLDCRCLLGCYVSVSDDRKSLLLMGGSTYKKLMK